jgi:hypothetical protein
MLGLLIREWMRGLPLRRLIEDRINYQRETKGEAKVPKLIRETMDDVEEIARFSAPKFLSCYIDIHGVFLAEREEDPLIRPEELNLMLELGVSRLTDVSLIGLGLSRTTVLALGKYLFEDDLGREDASVWLRQAPLDQFTLTPLARRDLLEVLEGIS